jgi:hypothetical protein
MSTDFVSSMPDYGQMIEKRSRTGPSQKANNMPCGTLGESCWCMLFLLGIWDTTYRDTCILLSHITIRLYLIPGILRDKGGRGEKRLIKTRLPHSAKRKLIRGGFSGKQVEILGADPIQLLLQLSPRKPPARRRPQ